MKEYAADKIRNVALVGHGGSGKTSLVEALLHVAGHTTRMGRIEDGNTVSDFDEEEIRRRISLYTSVVPIEFQESKINFFDTPGFPDFVGEVKSALHVADAAIVLVDSVAGVEVGTELTWQYCDEYKLPRFVLIAKMDRDNASFQQALASAQTLTMAKLVPVQLPWGERQGFKGIIDLCAMKASPGAGKETVEIPADLKAAAEEARVALVEAAAEGEDALLEKYLGGQELSPEEVERGFRKVVLAGTHVPVFVVASTAGNGLEPILRAVLQLFPSPAEGAPRVAQGKSGEELLPAADGGPLGALVWKTTADPFVGRMSYFRVHSGVMRSDSRVWNSKKSVEERVGTLHIPHGKEQIAIAAVHAGDIASVAKLSATATGDTLCEKAHPLNFSLPSFPQALYSVAVSPKTQADAAKISPTLTRLCDEDMTLAWHNEPSTTQTILQGMGDQHIDVAIRRAEAKFQVGLSVEVPRVPYRETITKSNSAQYRHKKQTGGAGQFGEVHLRVEPLAEGDFEFENEVFGGAVSNSYMPAIEKGVRSVMQRGVIAGFPVGAVKVAITDGKEHPVDSKPIAFEVAGREAFKLAVQGAGPVLLEPIMNVRIVVPEANMGDVMGDLNTRRARVQGMESERGKSIITAAVPQAEIQRYATDLRSITGGRGFFSMEFSHYEHVPSHVAQTVIAARQKELTGEETEE
ncbi:MAG: elongation factor G [Chloroflexi bacterium RBG_16_64_43]|nr:MAG: elongation factor G [Chloroflexi bacterium RBG_16_64_43]